MFTRRLIEIEDRTRQLMLLIEEAERLIEESRTAYLASRIEVLVAERRGK